MPRLLIATALALAIAGGAGSSLAQEKGERNAPQDAKKQDTAPPAAGKSLPEQAGASEPGSKVQGTTKDQSVLTNGVLTAPGALTDVDTAPARFSDRTDRDDQVSIAGYRLRHLTGDQRTEIVQGLGSKRDTPPSTDANAAYARVGAEIPSAIALTELTAMPKALTAKFAGLRGTAFLRTSGKVLVVDLDNSLVVAVLES